MSRILVAGDFAQRPGAEPLAGRAPHEVDRKTLPEWLGSLRVTLDLEVPNALYPGSPRAFAVTLTPKNLSRLTPDAIASALPILAGVQDRLFGLRGLKNFLACIPDFRKRMNVALVRPDLRNQLAADVAASRTEAPEPHPVVRELLALAKVKPEDDLYPLALLALRHMVEESLRSGATALDAVDVSAEIEHTATALSAQTALLFQQPPFIALERAWHGLDMLVRHHLPARLDAVACTEDELRADVGAGAPALQAWLRTAVREEAPYTAVLLAFDLDRSGDAGVLRRLAPVAADALTPVLVGTSAARGMLFGAPFVVPITSCAPVRPRYGHDHDDSIPVRGFPFEEPLGGPPTAHWPSAARVLARCLTPDHPEHPPAVPDITSPTQHLTHALAQSRTLRTGNFPVALLRRN